MLVFLGDYFICLGESFFDLDTLSYLSKLALSLLLSMGVAFKEANYSDSSSIY
jgi:hypothetical protein